jgi:hypothetical protein
VFLEVYREFRRTLIEDMLCRVLCLTTFLGVIVFGGSESECFASVAKGSVGAHSKQDIFNLMPRSLVTDKDGTTGMDDPCTWSTSSSQRSSSADTSSRNERETNEHTPVEPVRPTKGSPTQSSQRKAGRSYATDFESDTGTSSKPEYSSEKRFWEEVRHLEGGGIINPQKKTKW